jgi:hypothetical protein
MSKPKDNFSKLKAEWYKKLKLQGFNDIEYEDGSIACSVPTGYRNKVVYQQEIVRDYYYMCYHFLHEHQFETQLHKIIWEYHTDGMSIRNIAETLKKAKIKVLNKSQIDRIVRKLVKIMKSRYLSV